MREALDFVRGAVSTKDLVPVLTHFAFCGDRVVGFNGRVQISALCKTPFSCTVPALRLLAALDATDGEPKVDLVASELCVSAKRFKARIAVGPIANYPVLVPNTATIQLGSAWANAVRRLRPFVASDATRPWACAIAVVSNYAYATNNVLLVRCNIPRSRFPYVLPTAAIDEVLRIQQSPRMLGVDQHTATVHYDNGAYIITNLVEGSWPESPLKMLDEIKINELHPIAPSLAVDIAGLKGLCSDVKSPMVVFDGSKVSTFAGNDSNAEYTIKNSALGHGAYRVEPLELMLTEATHVDWTQHPRVPWRGKGIVGLLAGIKV